MGVLSTFLSSSFSFEEFHNSEKYYIILLDFWVSFSINNFSLKLLHLKVPFFIGFFLQNRIFKKKLCNCGSQNFSLLTIILSWCHVSCHKTFGPDRFSRFDVLIGNKQTNRQTSKKFKNAKQIF